MDITSYFQSRVRFLTPATIALAVMAGPEGNFMGSCCPVARIFTLVPPISITSTFIIEVLRRIGEDNPRQSRLAVSCESSFITKQSVWATVRYRPRPAMEVSQL